MAIKYVPILTLLLVLFSLECGLSYGEVSDESAGMSARNRPARQSCSYSSYYSRYYCSYSYYSNTYYYGSASSSSALSAGTYIGLSIASFVVCCLPCIITGIVICCCLCIPGCILNSQRNHGTSQVLTTTTVTEPAKYEQPAYPQHPQGYPQTGYPAQGYAPPPQGYYPAAAPAQPYSGQPDMPVKYEGGYDPTAHPGYTAYPTDQEPPSYTAAADQPPAQNQPQTHGIGFQT